MRGQRKKLAQVARIQARGLLHISNTGSPDDVPEFDEALAVFGLQEVTDDGETPAKEKQDRCYLWPCNLEAFNLWGQLQTQWRIGMAGATGLDYTAVIAYLRDVAGLKAKARADIFPSLRAMELAVLAVWAEKSNT